MALNPGVSKTNFGFDPRYIPGCQLWLDAADPHTRTVSSGEITAWNDKSGKGNNVTFVGTPGFHYNAVDQGVESPGSGSPNSYFSVPVNSRKSSTPNFHMFIVYKWLDYGIPSDNALWGQDSGGGFNRIQLLGISSGLSFLEFAFIYANYAWQNLYPLNTGSRTLYSAHLNYLWNSYINQNGSSIGNFVESYAANETSDTNTYFGNGSNGSGGISNFPSRIQYNEILIYTKNVTTKDRQAIEGYLAWKWGLQANLPAGHPYLNAHPFCRYFLPTDVSGGVNSWFDAADQSTTTLSGTNLTVWADKGKNNGDLNIVWGGISPTMTNKLNGLNIATFAYDQGLISSSTAAMSAYAKSTVYVWRTIDPMNISYYRGSPLPDNYTGEFANQGNAGANCTFGLVWDHLSGHYYYVIGPQGVAINLSGDAGTVDPQNSWKLVSMVDALDLGANIITLNGAAIPLVGNGIAYYTTSPANTLSHIPNTVASNRVIGNDLAEVVVADSALSPSDRERLEGYMAWKWGLQANLPSTHSFRMFPPAAIYAAPIPSINTPLDLPDCIMWFDPSNASTVTTYFGQATEILNQGTLGGSATSANGNGVVNYSTGVINGLNALDIFWPYGGAFIQYYLGIDIAIPNQARTIIVVYKLYYGASDYISFFPDVSFAGNYGYIYWTGNYPTLFNQLNYTEVIGADYPFLSFGSTNIIAYVMSSTSTADNRIMINGIYLPLTGGSGLAATFPTSTQRYGIGNLYGQSVYIGDSIFYNRALSQSEVDQVYNYLRTKWGA
jgi:hypothetical protein